MYGGLSAQYGGFSSTGNSGTGFSSGGYGKSQFSNLNNPMGSESSSRDRQNTADSVYGFRGNDFRTNFNLNSMNTFDHRSNFKDMFSNNNKASSFPSSSYTTSTSYGGSNSYGTPSYSSPSYGTSSYGSSSLGTPYGGASSTGYKGTPSNSYGGASNYGAQPQSSSVVGQYQPPPPEKPKPAMNTSSTKQITDIMKNHNNLSQQEFMDQGNLGKVIYSATLNSSATSKKYQDLVQKLRSSRQKFADQDFPANANSLSPPEDAREYSGVKSWMRPEDLWGNNYNLVYDGISPNDILQGNLGDCYLLSTIAAIAEYPKRIERLFADLNKSDCGCYGVNLVWRGHNECVLIDDQIPVDASKEPYFLKSKGNELWVILLEKAWAKLHKNYHRIDGQLTKESLHDFTGAPVRSFKTNQDTGALWERIVEADQMKYIMTTGTKGEDVGYGDPLNKVGLVSGHAYSLIGAFNVRLSSGQQVKLVKIRNPWGNFEWKNEWRDDDPQWSKVSSEDKRKMEYSQEDDGTFFMKYEELLQHFDGIQICYYQDNYVYQGISCRSRQNEGKYFAIQIPQDGYYYWNISQMTIRAFDEDTQDNPNQFYSETKFCIADSNGNIVQAFSGKKRDLYSPKYIEDKNRVTFKKGTYYAFVMVTWQRGATHSFGIGAYGPGAVDIKEAQKSQAGKLSELVTPWERNTYPSFQFEAIGWI